MSNRHPDDEIVDAELVEDDYLPALIEQGVDRFTDGPMPVYLTLSQRQLVREALAWFHDKGPRVRSTHSIMALMNYMADQETNFDCANCDSTGKVRTMYALEYCHCPIGIQRREEGS